MDLLYLRNNKDVDDFLTRNPRLYQLLDQKKLTLQQIKTYITKNKKNDTNKISNFLSNASFISGIISNLK